LNPKEGRLGGRRRWVAVASAFVFVGSAWLAAGVRVLDPSAEFALITGPFLRDGVGLLEKRRIVVAPPGLFRLTVFPLRSASVPLPDAAHAMLECVDGTRFGLKGTALVRALPARPRELAASGEGGGISRVVLASIRAAATVLFDADREERAAPTRRLNFERRLGEELSARGATLEELHLEGFDDLMATGATPRIPRDVKVLLVGLDGADWKIAEPLMAAGHMPNLLGLVRNGVSSNLLSITPMLSPVIWTSIATGVEPSRHGILDFLAPSATGKGEPVTSRARRVPTFWEMLSDAGARVGVTGWWATWPADPVHGYMVTDRVAYQLFGYSSDPRSGAGKTSPVAAYDTVRPLIVPTDKIPWTTVQSYLEGPRMRPEDFSEDERQRLDEFRTLLAAGTTYLDVDLAMRKRESVQLESVYFEGTDTVGHLFMPYRPPQLPSVDAAGFASFRSIVDRYYENADRMLGRLLEGRDGWTVIVVSDHGFASDATRPLTTDSRIGHGAAADWHRRFGIFVISGPGVKRGIRMDQASIYDIAPTILALFHQPVPRSWPGRVLGPVFEPTVFSTNPVRLRPDDPVRRGGGEGDLANDQESGELREKLQSLGYLGAKDATLMTTANNRGVGLLGDGKFVEAAAAFREALAKDPNEPTLMINLGIALRFAGERREAKRLFEKSFLSRDGRRTAGHQLAQLEMDDGDLEGAERILRSVLDREGGAAEVRNSLGLVLEKRGRLEDAAREYAESARLDANAAEARNNLGNLARKQRRDADAERWYLAAIAADPYFVGAYNNLALLCQDHGQIDRAIDLYGRALAKAPSNAVVMNNLASLYFATGENREARSLWRKALEADPKYTSPLNNLAGLALSEGDSETADGLLDRALALDANYGDARINKSLVARRRGDLEGARRELEAAEKDPRAAGTARMQLAFLDLAAGRPAEAAAKLERARRDLGDRTDVLNALGESYARMNERSRALAALKRSLSIDPEQLKVQAAIKNLDNQ
jgi:Tfp pilus assembly protein PilF/predicted AlkP superfamily pyrophosphatase or phosphodiesterase